MVKHAARFNLSIIQAFVFATSLQLPSIYSRLYKSWKQNSNRIMGNRSRGRFTWNAEWLSEHSRGKITPRRMIKWFATVFFVELTTIQFVSCKINFPRHQSRGLSAHIHSQLNTNLGKNSADGGNSLFYIYIMFARKEMVGNRFLL